jgi:hypothetical protein
VYVIGQVTRPCLAFNERGPTDSLNMCGLSIAPNGAEMGVALMKESKVRRKERRISRWNCEDFIVGSRVVEILGFTGDEDLKSLKGA